jgi:very-short-patch-repair endonuclease
MVSVSCGHCEAEAVKPLSYIEQRDKLGKEVFYCGRKCADTSHGEKMTGEQNPNFEGEFHGKGMAEFTKEERMVIGRRVSATMLERGTSEGSRNGRWRGGPVAHECTVCGTLSMHPRYLHEQIEAGNRQPACSVDCASELGRRGVKFTRTSIEVKMAEELEARDVDYVEQYVLGDKFRLDFFLPAYEIVIECDGNYWHTREDVVKRDARKNAYIAACGFKLFRFWETDINEDVEACVDIICAHINDNEDELRTKGGL